MSEKCYQIIWGTQERLLRLGCNNICLDFDIVIDVGWKLFNDFDRCDVIEICFTWPVSVYFWEKSIAASLAQSVDCVAVGGPRRNRL